LNNRGQAAADRFAERRGAGGIDPQAATAKQTQQAMRQGAYNFAQQAQQQGPLNFDNAPVMPQADSAMRDRMEQDIAARFERQYAPQFKQQSEDFEQQMANRGIPIGSELYTREKNRLEQQQNQMRQDNTSQAIQMGGQEMTNQFGMGMQAHQQGVSNIGQQYWSPFQSMQYFQQPYMQQQQQSWQGGQNEADRGTQRWLSQNQRFAPHAPNYSVQTTQMQIEAADRARRDQQQHDLAMAGFPR
jgi:hypothetical protein